MKQPGLKIRPVRPPAGYVGGKRNLSSRLVSLIDSTPHQLYAEAFVGMGGVFFRRTVRPKVEVINDISDDITTLFRILQRHYDPFIDLLKWRFADRAEFERLLRVDPSTCTDLERAARFLYLQRNAFGGKVVGRNFGISYNLPSKFRFSPLKALLGRIHDRMESVVIERMHYAEFVARYDRADSLIYLDPPYWGNFDDYETRFTVDDLARIASIIRGLTGKFIMSINDRPETREIFDGFDFEEVNVTYQLGARPKTAKELIFFGL